MQAALFSPHVECAGVHSPSEEASLARRELAKLLQEDEAASSPTAAVVELETGSLVANDVASSNVPPAPLRKHLSSHDVEVIACQLQLRYEEEELVAAEAAEMLKGEHEERRQEMLVEFSQFVEKLQSAAWKEREIALSTFDSEKAVADARRRRREHEERESANVQSWAEQESDLQGMDQDFYLHDKKRYHQRNTAYEEQRKEAEAVMRHEMMMEKIQTILDEEELVEEPYHMTSLGFRSTVDMYDL